MPPLGTYDSEEDLLAKPIRYSLDLEPAEYAALCRIICDHRVAGRRVSMRGLIRAAIHNSYPATAPAAPA